MQLLHQPASGERLGDVLQTNLQGTWTSFRAAVAFVKRSGTKHLAERLADFGKRHSVEIIAGIDHRGTSQEGLEDLLEALGETGRVIIFHNPQAFTFHPKVYLFKSEVAADLLLGSGNLTEGGLFTNYEASLRVTLDLTDRAQRAFLKTVEDVLDRWRDLTIGTAITLNRELLRQLVARGQVPIEALSAREPVEEEDQEGPEEVLAPIFNGHPVPRAPTSQIFGAARRASPRRTRAASSAGPTGFLMTLQKTDVGVGQISRGTSRRSPEIFIPLGARNAAPDFWGWPDKFTEDTPGKFDRFQVRMRLGTDIISVNFWYYPERHEFRMRSETLRSSGDIGDILRMEKVVAPGYEYYVEVIPKGTTQYPVYLALCTTYVGGISVKRYGYY